MANLNKTKTLFAFTSPRTIEKIIPEIDLLISSFKGQLWNSKLQTEYFKDSLNKPIMEIKYQRPCFSCSR